MVLTKYLADMHWHWPSGMVPAILVVHPSVIHFTFQLQSRLPLLASMKPWTLVAADASQKPFLGPYNHHNKIHLQFLKPIQNSFQIDPFKPLMAFDSRQLLVTSGCLMLQMALGHVSSMASMRSTKQKYKMLFVELGKWGLFCFCFWFER